MRRNPLRGVRTLTLRHLVREAKRSARRRPLNLREALIASLAVETLKHRRRR